MPLWDNIKSNQIFSGHTVPQPIIDLINQCNSSQIVILANYDPTDPNAGKLDFEASASKPETLPSFLAVQIKGINAYYKLDSSVSMLLYIEPGFPVTLSCQPYECSYDPAVVAAATKKNNAIIAGIISAIVCCCASSAAAFFFGKK